MIVVDLFSNSSSVKGFGVNMIELLQEPFDLQTNYIKLLLYIFPFENVFPLGETGRKVNRLKKKFSGCANSKFSGFDISKFSGCDNLNLVDVLTLNLVAVPTLNLLDLLSLNLVDVPSLNLVDVLIHHFFSNASPFYHFSTIFYQAYIT